MVEDRPEGPFLRVLDLGIAKALQADGPELTAKGTTVGTLQYMSPEQALGRRVDGRSDLYALATVLYVALAGRHPLALTWTDLGAAMAGIVREAPTPLDAPGVYPWLAAAIMKGLGKRPEDRHADAAAFRAALEGPGTVSGPATR